MTTSQFPKVGQRFTHFEGGLYEVYAVNPKAQFPISYKPVFLPNQPRHPKAANPGTTCHCTLANWPIITGQVAPPKEEN